MTWLFLVSSQQLSDSHWQLPTPQAPDSHMCVLTGTAWILCSGGPSSAPAPGNPSPQWPGSHVPAQRPHFVHLGLWESGKVLVQLCAPVDYSPPSSSVHGILQARILEWVAISCSSGSSWPRDPTESPALQVDSLPFEPPGTLGLPAKSALRPHTQVFPPLDPVTKVQTLSPKGWPGRDGWSVESRLGARTPLVVQDVAGGG